MAASHRYEQKFGDLRTMLAAVRDEQYQQQEFVPSKKAYQSRAGRTVANGNYMLRQLYKNLRLPQTVAEEDAVINPLTDNVFNVEGGAADAPPATDDTVAKGNVPWGKVPIEDRVQMMSDFLEGKTVCPAKFDPPLDITIKEQIIGLVQEGSLNKRADVMYDVNNRYIIKIPVLKYSVEEARYYLNLVTPQQAAKKRVKKMFKAKA